MIKMVFFKSFLHAVLISIAILFGSALLFGFQSVSFIASIAYSPVGFIIILLTFFLELVGIRW